MLIGKLVTASNQIINSPLRTKMTNLGIVKEEEEKVTNSNYHFIASTHYFSQAEFE